MWSTSPATRPSKAGSRASPAARRRPVVVVAEDDQDMLNLIVASLRRFGIRVLEARDGDELCALLRRMADAGASPDLVLSDIHMPGRDGLEALVELKALHPGVPMVMMTGSGNGAARARAAELGATALLEKPLDLLALRLLVLELSRR